MAKASYGDMGRKKTDGAVFKGGYLSGEDAAYIEPKLIPDYELLPRDDSGGPEWDAYTQQFGDGGYVTGDKAHLAARDGGPDDPETEDEVDEQNRRGSAKAVSKVERQVPSSLKKLAKE